MMVAKKKELKSRQYSLRITDSFHNALSAMAALEDRSVSSMLDVIVKRAAAQAGVSVVGADTKPARKKAAKKTTKKAVKKG